MCRQILRADFGYCCPASAGGANHAYCVCKNFGLIRFNCVTPDRVHRRSESDRLAVNGKHRFVTGISRKFLHVLVVIPERHCKTIHLDPESLLEQLLATDDFVLAPFFIVSPSEFFLLRFPPGSITVTLCP